MLVSIEVNTIHSAGDCHAGRVEELASEIGAGRAIRFAETGTPLFGAREFRGEDALWRVNRRRADNQNRGHRHSWLYRRFPDFVH